MAGVGGNGCVMGGWGGFESSVMAMMCTGLIAESGFLTRQNGFKMQSVSKFIERKIELKTILERKVCASGCVSRVGLSSRMVSFLLSVNLLS